MTGADARGPVRIAVLGASGRMGVSLLRAIHESAEFELAGALVSTASAARGTDAARLTGVASATGVVLTDDPAAALRNADVALDFSVAGAVGAHVRASVARGCALLVGTTGLDPAAADVIEAASRRIAVLVAPNTSLGVNLLAQLVENAAAALPPDYDIEIFEAHHRDKVDAPSGTARQLGEAAAAGRGHSLAELAGPLRDGRSGARRGGSIGFSVVRGGDIVGEHTVIYAGPGERLELSHRAHDRMTFAYGALRACRWLRGRGAGRYKMSDVLGFG